MKNFITMIEKDSIEILKAESNHTFPLHSHESFCFGIVHQGRVIFEISNHKKILSKGMCYIIPSNVGVIITPLERYAYTTICFKNDKKDSLMNYQYEEYFPCISVEDQILQLCNRYLNGESATSFMSQIHSLLEPYRAPLTCNKKSDDYLILQGKEYIRQHLYEPFNLEQVADFLHISKYHFIRKFKQNVGVTPNQYYIQAKIYAAKQALKQNEKETDVAANLNFSDQSYLCNVFKKQMGISMKDFKQNFVQL